MKIIIINIKELVQVRENEILKVSGAEMNKLPTIKNAYLLIENDHIADFGEMKNCPSINIDTTIDARGKMVLPTWCESHTHIVYAGNRDQEFVDRINGMSYEEIANRGGGILNSVKKLNETSEEELWDETSVLLSHALTFEIKIRGLMGLGM